eukprot:7337376-Ditylum_brightwellii.AAC.1
MSPLRSDALHPGEDAANNSLTTSTLQQEEMQFLSANGTAESLISVYSRERHLINHPLLSGLSLEMIAAAILAKELKSDALDHI